MAEKRNALEPTTAPVTDEQLEILSAKGHEDNALEWLKQHRAEGHFAHDGDRMRRLRRRIDIRVIPFLALSYLVNFLDKISLNVCDSLLDGKHYAIIY